MVKKLLSLLTFVLLAAASFAEAPQRGRVPWIGVIATGSPSTTGTINLDAFRKGLDELGYIEEKPLALSTDTPKGN